jgi:hypothetical protein
MLGRKTNMKLPFWAAVLPMNSTELNRGKKGMGKNNMFCKRGIKVSFAQKKPNSRSRKDWAR